LKIYQISRAFPRLLSLSLHRKSRPELRPENHQRSEPQSLQLPGYKAMRETIKVFRRIPGFRVSLALPTSFIASARASLSRGLGLRLHMCDLTAVIASALGLGSARPRLPGPRKIGQIPLADFPRTQRAPRAPRLKPCGNKPEYRVTRLSRIRLFRASLEEITQNLGYF